MTPEAIVERWYLAVTAWAEARGLGPDAMARVAWVIRNRRDDPRKRWPQSIREVVTQHRRVRGRDIYQFSCWSPHDPNRLKMADPLGQGAEDARAFLEALRIADHVLTADPSENPLPGVYWYTDRSIPPPAWARKLVEVDPQAPMRWYREA